MALKLLAPDPFAILKITETLFEGGNGNPLQYSCLENPMDGEAWWAVVHGVSKSRTRRHFHFSLSCIGEGNGNPLQCSFLENPRDGGAWWAAIYGVAQSRTRLKRLSSSSSSSRKKLLCGLCVLCCAKSLQSCLTLCDPMDCSPPGSFVHGVLQARMGVGGHALLQEIFLTQGRNLCLFCLLYWQAIFYH